MATGPRPTEDKTELFLGGKEYQDLRSDIYFKLSATREGGKKHILFSWRAAGKVIMKHSTVNPDMHPLRTRVVRPNFCQTRRTLYLNSTGDPAVFKVAKFVRLNFWGNVSKSPFDGTMRVVGEYFSRRSHVYSHNCDLTP